MRVYSFNVKLHEGKFEIQVDTNSKYGWFEHDELGDERGGGLWFQVSDQSTPGDAGRKLELIDYDGTACLPKSVLKALRENGFIVGEEFE